jgi:hypothetical protein
MGLNPWSHDFGELLKNPFPSLPAPWCKPCAQAINSCPATMKLAAALDNHPFLVHPRNKMAPIPFA